eukprot:TRINITY_DN14787_c0_g1_i1.p1 TRINITY_DN14787_c0_g1~~TRINITY_DN14787_c0_g1_i1.p1  ORF type:complete len:152 (-),score=28.52 TRINITY_DN14787_c0_g1_i1:32-463(-)
MARTKQGRMGMRMARGRKKEIPQMYGLDKIMEKLKRGKLNSNYFYNDFQTKEISLFFEKLKGMEFKKVILDIKRLRKNNSSLLTYFMDYLEHSKSPSIEIRNLSDIVDWDEFCDMLTKNTFIKKLTISIINNITVGKKSVLRF